MPTFSFPRSRRLTHAREYQGVYAYRLRAVRGPMTLSIRPNHLPHWRLGLAVPRRVGSAVARNRAKRIAREVFRFAQHELPLWTDAGRDSRAPGGEGESGRRTPLERGYDAVVSFHGTDALADMSLDQCREWFGALAAELHARSVKRRGRAP